jgi:hypothetical protein
MAGVRSVSREKFGKDLIRVAEINKYEVIVVLPVPFILNDILNITGIFAYRFVKSQFRSNIRFAHYTLVVRH